jgi:hypothetical protein
MKKFDSFDDFSDGLPLTESVVNAWINQTVNNVIMKNKSTGTASMIRSGNTVVITIEWQSGEMETIVSDNYQVRIF